jgi:hypothetical protein
VGWENFLGVVHTKRMIDEARVTLPYEVYSRTFDRCVADRFAELQRRFRTWDIALTIVNLVLVSAATVLQAWDDGDVADGGASAGLAWHDTVTIVAGASALILRGVEQTVGLARAVAACGVAHADLVYYLSTRRPMPSYVHARILGTNTLCFAFPSRRCAAAPAAAPTPTPAAV